MNDKITIDITTIPILAMTVAIIVTIKVMVIIVMSATWVTLMMIAK